MDAFWQGFWPNLASTILGLILGLPIALWTNRRLTAYSDRLQHQQEQSRLALSLKTLAQALDFNLHRLKFLAETLEGQRVAFDTAVDYSAWEAVRTEVTPYLHDPKLQQRLAYHFSRMRSLTSLNDMYLNYAAGMGSALGGSENTRDALRAYLHSMLQKLYQETRELAQEIAAVQAKL